MNPKISVIIPIYNVEKYLDKCLNSVRNQTLKEIEIICVDDCSPDDSYLIAERHAAEDSRISLIRHEKNLGLGGARNTAIRVAKADFIASVDSDDYLSPKMLETLWKASDGGRVDIVCCGFNRVDENDNILSYEEFTEASINNTKNKIDIFSTLNPAFWNKLWRKSLFIDNHIYFPNHDYFEDMSTTPRVLAKAKKIKIIKGRYYQYLIRTGSITGNSSEKHLIDYFKGFEILMQFLEDNKLGKRYKKELNRYIRGKILFYAKSILGTEDFVDNKKQYLRYLILFRISFNENFEQFQKFDLGDSIAALGQEDLHGEYYHKYKKALKEIDEKEDYIARQLDEIERKKKELEVRSNSIVGLRNEISDITKNLSKTKAELKSSVNKFKNSQKVVTVKEDYISKQLVDIDKKKQLITEYATTINSLRGKIRGLSDELSTSKIKTENLTDELSASKSELASVARQIIINQQKSEEKVKNIEVNNLQRVSELNETIASLESKLSDEISFPQMLSIIVFATLTKPTMNKKQTLKLMNKPKLFFQDSKSNFAKKYASWFKII